MTYIQRFPKVKSLLNKKMQEADRQLVGWGLEVTLEFFIWRYGAALSMAGVGELPVPGAFGKGLRKNVMTATEPVSEMSLLLHKQKWALLKIDGTLRYHCNIIFMHTYSGHLSLKPSAGVCWSHLFSLGAFGDEWTCNGTGTPVWWCLLRATDRGMA